MRKYLLILAAAAAFFACVPQHRTATPSARDYAPYIKAYTGGIVTTGTELRIELAEAAPETPTEGLFQFTPKLPGRVIWHSASSVSFVPDEGALRKGQNYSARFALGTLWKEAPESFCFGFTVKAPAAAATAVEKEQDAAEGFCVLSTALADDHIDVLLNGRPVNAREKGMVELSGVARSYVQVQDSLLQVFFEGRKEAMQLVLDKGIRTDQGESLDKTYTRVFPLEEWKPALEIPLQGSVLPDKKQLLLPFRAVNLSAVEVRVVKIYESNVLMFLQDNDLGESSALRRSGRLVYRRDIPLDPSKDLHQWNTHSLDLSGLFKQEPGAIYRIRLSFRQEHSLYGGRQPQTLMPLSDGLPTAEDEAQWDNQETYYWDNDYDWDNYHWEEADDPEKASYYMDSSRFPAIQLIASDLGLMAQYGDGDTIWLTVTDLLTARPVPGAQVEVYDFQLQRLGKAQTDRDGFASLPLERKPFAVVAKAGGSVAYLKVNKGGERSLSRFDVGGEVLQKGLKGFVYGERGVWRPGDPMYLTLLVSSHDKALPEGHPATMELYTPEGQFYSSLTRRGTDGFYRFTVPTKADDPTGYWNAYFKLGGSTFHKILHLENIKPNRLKIQTDYPAVLQAGKELRLHTSASWLSGGNAAHNAVRAQLTLRRLNQSPFKGFESYSFDNPNTAFSTSEQELFRGKLDQQGQLTQTLTLPPAEAAPGLLQAYVMTSVEESGGDESFTTESLLYSPYSAYVGIRVPEGDYLETDKDQTIRIAVVDADGRRVSGHPLEYAVFKTGWNWWWEQPGGELDSYVSGPSVSKLSGGRLTSAKQDVSFTLRDDYPAWGRYLILVRDLDSGHTSGRLVTLDWPDYQGRANRRDPEALTQLSFSLDKEVYQAGEKATVYIPAAPGGRALVSLENAGGVLRREWVNTSGQDTPWTFTVEEGMAPNIYVHLTLLQAYGHTQNDLPLRLYGVQRVKVENPASRLEPLITLPDVLRPEESFTVKIREKNGRPMTYTLAIVDEGLLDLTAFKTPDPWSRMYRQEALGVHTWDMYDQVVGAFSGRFTPLAAIGGDEDALRSARKDQRFNPVVLCLEPRTLEKGSDELRLTLPQYVGSVRVMLVAGHDGAYGHAAKTVAVQSPLMVLPTLPRVLGCGDEIALPVHVFAMEDEVKEADIQVQLDGPASLKGPSTQKLQFKGKGDQLVYFPLKAGDEEGTLSVTIKASGAGHHTQEKITLPLRHAQPQTCQVERFTLSPGETRSLAGGSLQLAGFPALDARGMYIAMRDYPYDCTEQLSARGLTLLSLLPLLPESDAAEARERIPGLIAQLYARQGSDGGFSYWKGGKSDSWVSSMAGHFLSQAAQAGFPVQESVLKAWKGYQAKNSQVYRLTEDAVFPQLDEAYRLYTLALAGAPSQAGMNRLREAGEMGQPARYVLASAYALAGKAQTAAALLDAGGKDLPEYKADTMPYGSALRDRYMALDALVLCQRVNDALVLGRESLSKGTLTTQESAFAAVAYRHLYDRLPTSGIQAVVDGKEQVSAQSLLQVPAARTVQNTGDGVLYGTSLTLTREPLTHAVSNGLSLQLSYTDESGAPLNPASLRQGTRFRAQVKVSNTLPRDLQNLALSVRIPAGWEIVNERMSGGGEQAYDYRDIKDDRVNCFFDLPGGRYKTFTLQLRAAYEGRYTLPSTVCEAMYEADVNAATASSSTEVVR